LTRAWAPNLARQQCEVLAALGIDSILGARFATSVFHRAKTHPSDDQYLNEWTAVLAGRIESLT
jgi:hypothetical protein